MSNLSFSHSVFYPFEELSAIFINFKIVNYRLYQIGMVQNWSLGKVLSLYMLWNVIERSFNHKRN